MIVYRLALNKFSHELFAPGFAGRWNKEGQKVLYTAESISLAMLENMVRRQGLGFNKDFSVMLIKLPNSIKITEIKLNALPEGWRDYNNYSICQDIGSEWFESFETPVLKVPSALNIDESNFVINAIHPDFKKIHLEEVRPFIADGRIDAILHKSK